MGAQALQADSEQGAPSLLASPAIAALLIVAVAIATRIAAWWNPVPHVDDQFYLLAGEQLLGGNWPYVDVWDRKPLGLFLLYAEIAAIGGGSMLGLNLIATAFAGATAMVIRHISLRFASPTGATLAALAYLLVIPLVGGQTGQSPVFYNLLVASAAWLLIDAVDRDRGAIFRRALAAMGLCGLAMTIKQISLVEGCFFGLAFLWLLRRRGASVSRILPAALAMVGVALLPTALMVAGYALAGELDSFLFATVTSIFLKSGWSSTAKLAGIAYFFFNLTPLLLVAIGGAVLRHGRGAMARDRLLLGWMVAALLGYATVPHFFDHYALPVTVPLAVSAATFLSRQTGPLYLAALAAICLILPPILQFDKNSDARAEFERLLSAVEHARHGGCIHVGDGPTHLYSATDACHVSRYLFPDHLNLVIETEAVGTDTGRELAAILARRPAVIVTQARRPGRYSVAYEGFLRRVGQDYRPIYTSPAAAPQLVSRVTIWQRRDLPPPNS